MTPNGRKCLEIMRDLEGANPDQEGWFEAQDITDRFPGLENRGKPVMTVSSYLTHLKHKGYVERAASSDKLSAWWRMTTKGRKALDA